MIYAVKCPPYLFSSAGNTPNKQTLRVNKLHVIPPCQANLELVSLMTAVCQGATNVIEIG